MHTVNINTHVMKKILYPLSIAFIAGSILNAHALPRNYKYTGLAPKEIEKEAREAGRKGIPWRGHYKTIKPGSNALNTHKKIQDAINSTPWGRAVVLSAQDFKINKPIRMKSGVALRGSTSNGKQTTIIDTRTKGNNDSASALVYFGKFSDKEKIQDAGIERLTLKTNLGKPPTGWNTFKNYRNNNKLKLVDIAGNKNWLENVRLIYAADNPVTIQGNNNVILNTTVNGSWNKGGGRGYFIVTGLNNLIAGNKFDNIRHVVIQRRSSSRAFSRGNVFARNTFHVDINFHNGDGGRNLIVSNSFEVPRWHRWGDLAFGVRGQHQAPGKNNFLIKNTTRQDNKKNKMPTGNNIIDGFGHKKYSGRMITIK